MSLDWLRTFPQFIISHHGLTTFANFLANIKNQKIKNYLIKRFVTKYNINMAEALIEDPLAYSCFNDFFIRHLKRESRPLAKADIISPVDGFISEIGVIEDDQILQAKGHYYSISDLLACDKDIASQFINGHFATLYLSPKDYHRVHMPIQAQLTSMTYIPGSLFSVKPSTVRVISKLFTRNERLIIFFSTPIGPMALVMVGAMIVGAIGTNWHGDIKRSNNRVDFNYNPNAVKSIDQGDEIGYFKLGSTVVLLFSNEAKMNWKEHVKAGSRLLFGEPLGEVIKT